MTTKAPHCEACSGVLEQALLPSYDFSAYTGVTIIVRNVPGYRCATCQKETVPGGVLHMVFRALLIEIAKVRRRLSASEARLFRRMMNVTQQELATRMAISRETVAKWECGDSEISPQHDYILRIMLLTGMMQVDPTLLPAKLLNQLLTEMQSARIAPPEATPPIDLEQYRDVLVKRGWPTHGQGTKAVAYAR